METEEEIKSVAPLELVNTIGFEGKKYYNREEIMQFANTFICIYVLQAVFQVALWPTQMVNTSFIR